MKKKSIKQKTTTNKQQKKMELKVWVEGYPRIVCGVSETTTCQVFISYSLL